MKILISNILSGICIWLCFNTGFTQNISGIVFEDKNYNQIQDPGETGIQGVAVSDQMHVVITDQNGYYQLQKMQNFHIVFISQPDGYKSSGSFWQNLINDKANFGLIKQNSKVSFSFIQASDTHISEASIDRMDKFRKLADSLHPDLILITGDLVKDALRVSEAEATKVYTLFKTESSKLKSPAWLVPGNHEIFGIERHLSLVSPLNPLYGREMYHRYFGPDYYSFNYGGVHFIALNSLEFDDLFYYGRIDSIQLEWLKSDVSTISKSTPVVTFQHVPFFTGGLSMAAFESEGLGRTVEIEKGKPQIRHTVSNAMEVMNILKDYNYPLALAGHYHYQQIFSLEGVQTRFEQTGAVISSSRLGPYMLPSGITLYHVTNGMIDKGKFIPLDN